MLPAGSNLHQAVLRPPRLPVTLRERPLKVKVPGEDLNPQARASGAHVLPLNYGHEIQIET